MRYKVVVAYDGSGYIGWQTQHQKNSVQEAIESVLSLIHCAPITIVGSGRTDRGVHAYGQVFHFDSMMKMTCDKFKYVLNTQLDKSIHILSIEQVEDEFHARFSVVKKEYIYLVSTHTHNPMMRNYMHIERNDISLKRMQETCSIFVGTFDFTSFTSTKIDKRKQRVKTIYKFTVEKQEHIYKFTIVGDGFLRYMVRMLVQTVLMVGMNKLEPVQAFEMLQAKDKDACRHKADACGLYLSKVYYE